MKHPVKVPPSVEQARRYVIYGAEHESGNSLFLVTDVKVEGGKGIDFKDIPQIQRPGNADPEGQVYQLHGSLKSYMCNPVSTGPYPNAGKNCRIYDNPRAIGEWQRTLRDYNPPDKYGTLDQPPPK